MPATMTASPFVRIGAARGVDALVERFYDLMDSDPGYATLRALHGPCLAASRQSLAGYLTAWLGGPTDWFQAKSRPCLMGLHRSLGISRAAADQWVDAMARAMADVRVDRMLARELLPIFERMATSMIASGPQG
ncbi:group II truncated hemoglobin [Polymorphobacter sp.]|uniref:group II truncated hemoglobin n=1 Tax=Polymorphobacter sp. TaxID=1909290 RepID=UPI003F6EC3DF